METARKYQLVIQFPVVSTGDFDHMVEAEQRMREALKGTAEVEKREHGSGECNVYMVTDAPEADAQKALLCLEEQTRDQAKAAYRAVGDDHYKLLWPPGATVFRIL